MCIRRYANAGKIDGYSRRLVLQLNTRGRRCRTRRTVLAAVDDTRNESECGAS